MRFLSLEKLQQLSPFGRLPWDAYDVSSLIFSSQFKEMVEEALATGKLEATSFSALLQDSAIEDVPVSIVYHAQRIAWLMKHGWSDPIDLNCNGGAIKIEHISSAFPTLDEVRVGNARGTCQSALTLCLMPQSCAK